MKKELNNIIIIYSNDSKEYIDYIASTVQKIEKEIIDFFNIDKLPKKVEIVLHDNLEEFRNVAKLLHENELPNWLCGFLEKNYLVHTLSLKEYKKTEGHENGEVDDIIHLILHEFVHACHMTVNPSINAKWLSEGLATTISHQYDNAPLVLSSSLEDIISNKGNYLSYHTLFEYIYKNYDKNYINNLIMDNNLH